jgi:membrane associated rhomboid family serine protease
VRELEPEQISEPKRREGRHETELERLDRNLTELVGEVRIAQTGVQILFAFLLVLPFNARFAGVDTFEKVVYAVTLMATALAAGLLIAPTAHHRLLFRRDDKRYLVFSANRLTVVGLGFVALATCGALLLVIDFVLGRAAACALTGFTALFLTGLWYGWPLRRRRQLDRAPRLDPHD